MLAGNRETKQRGEGLRERKTSGGMGMQGCNRKGEGGKELVG
jgi:hypothetical protein